MNAVTFTVWGVPAPQGSKSAVVRGGRAIVIEGKGTPGREKHKAWRQAVAETARRHLESNGGQPFPAEPLEVTLRFHLPKPKSAPKWKLWVTTKPDVDKLVRSVLDGLADGGLLGNDSHVVFVAACKQYAVDRATSCDVDVRLAPADPDQKFLSDEELQARSSTGVNNSVDAPPLTLEVG